MLADYTLKRCVREDNFFLFSYLDFGITFIVNYILGCISKARKEFDSYSFLAKVSIIPLVYKEHTLLTTLCRGAFEKT